MLRGVVAENFEEDVLRDRLFVFEEYFQSEFHAIERSGFPDELNSELCLRVLWWRLGILQLKSYFFRCRDSDYVASTFPCSPTVLFKLELEFIARYKSDVVTFVWEHEVRHSLVR